MNPLEEKQEKAINYYDKFSKIYDWISSKSYYQLPRTFAIEALQLQPQEVVLNLPCGTGQNFEYFQQYLANTGQIIGIDLSTGMLQKAQQKIADNDWRNITLKHGDATKIDADWIKKEIGNNITVDAVFCDLGLSGFPTWQKVIDNLIGVLKPNGRIVIMDWYIEKPSLRGAFIAWIGKGEVNRPIWQYLEGEVENFKVDHSFKRGEMFVASGNKKE